MRRRERLSCAVGNILNDIVRMLLTSFQFLFFVNVKELRASQVSIITFTGPISEAVFSVLIGYFGDRVDIPSISRKFGSKSWHLIATCLMAINFPLLMNRCLLCEGREQTWLPVFYYSFLEALRGLSFNMVEINHLAFITAFAKNVEQATTLSTLRFVSKFRCRWFRICCNWF